MNGPAKLILPSQAPAPAPAPQVKHVASSKRAKGVARYLEKLRPTFNSFIQSKSNQVLVDILASLDFSLVGEFTRKDLVSSLKKVFEQSFIIRFNYNCELLKSKPTGDITREALLERTKVLELLEDLQSGATAKMVATLHPAKADA